VAFVCAFPTERYDNSDGTFWGYDGDGDIFCSVCGGTSEVACPRSATEGPFEDDNGVFYMCWDCDAPLNAQERGRHERVTCPCCQN
jgi:hypothetical protein